MPEAFGPMDLKAAMERLSMLKFWPADTGTQSRILELLAAKVPHKEALEWLVAQFTERIGQWHGSAELLGVLNTRYGVTDGKSYWSQIPGYTASDGESRYLARESDNEVKEIAPSSRKMLESLASKKGFPKW